MSARDTTHTTAFWVQTPWRAWGVVYGQTREEAITNAEADRAREIASLERLIERYRTVSFEVESASGHLT